MRYHCLIACLFLSVSAPALAAPPSTSPRLIDADLSTYRDNLRTGAPKDAIPSIDDPEYWSASEAEQYMRDQDRVIGVYLDGQARAYPQRILVWHEIVNDSIAGQRVAISYCPLTGTGLGFERGSAEFGVSGKLMNSNLVMYDRSTGSRYPQILGAGISGPMAGKGLQEVRLVFTEWAKWKQRHPDTQVLSTDTDSMRNYQRDPYGNYNPLGGYYEPNSSRMFPVLNEDGRYPPKREVLAFRDRQAAVAVDLETLSEQGVITHEAAGSNYVIIHDPVLDTGWVFRGKADIDADSIRFAPEGPRFQGRDELEAVNAFRAMWFAWAAFYPDTAVIDGAA